MLWSPPIPSPQTAGPFVAGLATEGVRKRAGSAGSRGEMPRLYSCLAVTCLDFQNRARVRPRVGFHFSCVSHQTALLTLHSPHKQRCSHLLLRDPFTVGQGGVSSPCSPRTSAVTAGRAVSPLSQACSVRLSLSPCHLPSTVPRGGDSVAAHGARSQQVPWVGGSSVLSLQIYRENTGHTMPLSSSPVMCIMQFSKELITWNLVSIC